MKEIELPVKSNDRLSITEITTFEYGIILAFDNNASIIGYITFEDYDDPIWCFYNSINTANAQVSNNSLYNLVNTLIKDYHIANLKLLEFNK